VIVVAARPRSRRGEGRLLRTEILAAATELLDTNGDERALTLRAVARRVGIAAPSIYPHFPDRPAIVLAVVRQGFVELADRIRSAIDSAGHDILSGKLLGLSWISAFAALFLAITGLAAELGRPDLQTMLWPTWSGFLVGVLYLGEGAVRRNVLHYGLGTWLALTSTAALSLGIPSPFWVLAIAGGGGFAVAVVLERRRLAHPGRLDA
jgi:AcrR family transcriptional regulator